MDASSSTTHSLAATSEESRDLSLVFLTLVLLALIVLLCLLLARRGNLLARMKRFVFRLAALDDGELGQEEKAILTKNDQLYFANPLREEKVLELAREVQRPNRFILCIGCRQSSKRC